MVNVILVEESLSESALACIAIALRRPSARVTEARNLAEAKKVLGELPGGKALVILGWRALRDGLDAFVAAATGATVIGFAGDLGESRERALRAGVRAIYDKPVEWSEYLGAMEAILGEWLAAPAGARTSSA